jgi:hypothetical protein
MDLYIFINDKLDIDVNQLNPNTLLAQDLGIYGLDSIYFFDAFFDEFKLSNVEAFDSELYIDCGPDFKSSFKDWLKNIFIKERRKYLRPDISLGHLQKVIEKGEWFDEK